MFGCHDLARADPVDDAVAAFLQRDQVGRRQGPSAVVSGEGVVGPCGVSGVEGVLDGLAGRRRSGCLRLQRPALLAPARLPARRPSK